MRSARSTSRVGSRPASRQSCSREISPAEGKELNKTYTQKSVIISSLKIILWSYLKFEIWKSYFTASFIFQDALIDQSNGPPRRFALDLSVNFIKNC